VKSTRSRGNRFETIACGYLAKKGYKILDRNVYLMRKELDIVAMEGDTIVFVEVKGRASGSYGSPVEAVGALKRRRLVMAATAYLKRRRLLEWPCRFDVVGIRLKADGRPDFDHVENAFDAGG
jgi:putative endonuclease